MCQNLDLQLLLFCCLFMLVFFLYIHPFFIYCLFSFFCLVFYLPFFFPFFLTFVLFMFFGPCGTKRLGYCFLSRTRMRAVYRYIKKKSKRGEDPLYSEQHIIGDSPGEHELTRP
jgi:hypothetical protein